MTCNAGRWRALAAASMLGMFAFAATAAADGGWQFVLEFGNGLGDIAVDSNHNVYVLSGGRGWIQVFTPEGQFLREKTGFDDSKGIAIDENDVIYVIQDCRVHRYDLGFQPLGSWDSCLGQGDLQMGLGIDVRDGIVYIGTPNALLKFTTDGTPVAQFMDYTAWTDVFALPDGSVWGVNGNTYRGLVRLYSADGEVLTEWPTILPDEEASSPRGLAVDSRGRVFVCDEGARVKIFLPDGTLDDLIQWQVRVFVSLELDGDDVLYVGDGFFTNHVMKFRYIPVATEPATWGGLKARYR